MGCYGPMSYQRLLSLARQLKAGQDIHYLNNGRRRILSAMNNLRKLVPSGAVLLDIGGHDFKKNLGYSFKEFTEAVCDCEYHFVTRNTLDIRNQRLPFPDGYFDFVVSSETIEHLWVEKMGGMISWDGISNFWRESHRVLKDGGKFMVNTRNRYSMFSFYNVLKGEEMSIAYSTPRRCGHVRELSATDFRRMAKDTDLFTSYNIWSERSVSMQKQIEVETYRNRIEDFIGRPLKQEELYDTIFFLSEK
jgi:SAM-dependent methyltransferase